MLHLEINVKRRHIYVLVAAIALIVTILPVSSWAAHQFTDVPNSNIFHDDIGWLADAGVTLGCNPPANDEFCPEDNVRRETMAAFMRRLAENQVVDAKTAITAESAAEADVAAEADNADLLDGYEANDLVRATSWDGNLSTITSTSFVNVGGTMTLEASTRCLLIMDAAVDWDGNGTDPVLWMEWFVNGTSAGVGVADQDSLNENDAFAVNASQVVDPGTYTLNLRGRVSAGSAGFERGSYYALCVPFDGTGATPTGTASTSGASGAEAGDPTG